MVRVWKYLDNVCFVLNWWDYGWLADVSCAKVIAICVYEFQNLHKAIHSWQTLVTKSSWSWRRYQMSEYILSCLVARYTNYNKPLHLHIVKANSILIKILWDSSVCGYRQHRNTNKCYMHSKYLCQTWKKFSQCHNPYWEGRIHKSL